MKLEGSTKVLQLKFSPKYLPDIDCDLEFAGIKSVNEFFVSSNVLIRFQLFKV
jgi:hypothetical protein